MRKILPRHYAYFFLSLLAAMILMCCTSCNRNIPHATLPTDKNPCDEAIQAILDSVESVEPTYIYDVITEAGVTDTVISIDSASCQQVKLMALDVVSKYNTLIKERDYFKALAQARAKKIVNNINLNSKNKNTQIGDANVSQQKNKGPAVVGDGNVTTVKLKQSAVGDGNKLDNSKKGVGWFWIFVGGYLFCHVLHKIIIPALMGTNPFTAAISKFKTISTIFRT